MSEQESKPVNPLNLLIDTFWALMPEKTASEIATFKKMALISVRDTLGWAVSKEIEWTDRHLENARKMRDQYREKRSEEGA